jgi:hypothetical protein
VAGVTREQFQCLCCGGKYFDLCADGMIYFHVCPPLPPDENFFAAPRPNARNETTRAGGPNSIPAIVSDGLGVNCLSNPNLIEPAWITQLKRRAAAADENE